VGVQQPRTVVGTFDVSTAELETSSRIPVGCWRLPYTIQLVGEELEEVSGKGSGSCCSIGTNSQTVGTIKVVPWLGT
jgi:hypothetical protein